MRSFLLALGLLSAPFLLSAALLQDPVPEPEPEPMPEDLNALRLEILEKQVAALQAWAQAQAIEAASLAAACDMAEEAGFFSGINPRSREILLDAIRAHAAGLQTDIPGLAAEEPEEEPRRGR